MTYKRNGGYLLCACDFDALGPIIDLLVWLNDLPREAALALLLEGTEVIRGAASHDSIENGYRE